MHAQTSSNCQQRPSAQSKLFVPSPSGVPKSIKVSSGQAPINSSSSGSFSSSALHSLASSEQD
uniref:Uncharacterized protein n=1 Tax=Cucumis melo TaxID=3656 RepID=A0A9I9D166_CUCME